jgi:hypothetical protein
MRLSQLRRLQSNCRVQYDPNNVFQDRVMLPTLTNISPHSRLTFNVRTKGVAKQLQTSITDPALSRRHNGLDFCHTLRSKHRLISQSLYSCARDRPFLDWSISIPCSFKISLWRSSATLPVHLSSSTNSGFSPWGVVLSAWWVRSQKSNVAAVWVTI